MAWGEGHVPHEARETAAAAAEAFQRLGGPPLPSPTAAEALEEALAICTALRAGLPRPEPTIPCGYAIVGLASIVSALVEHLAELHHAPPALVWQELALLLAQAGAT